MPSKKNGSKSASSKRRPTRARRSEKPSGKEKQGRPPAVAAELRPRLDGGPAERAAKDGDLEAFRDRAQGTALTTDQGVPIPHTDDSLKLGPRGPSLILDFHLREKITRFDHERIPERVVHARGSGAHGFFRVYESLEEWTRADFLCDPDARTPVFVRFSTVVGSRGSADTVRDARGFATKFYTREGNFDLVGNNIPVFFIQDGLKFPDLVHAIKPEPHHEMPQASSAHDTFWDFVSLVPETLHMVMWLMSDRALPRSYRMMDGFGVHTFRLVNREGGTVLCKFHWKPVLGAHSLVWEEAQQIAGKDPDFHRRDLWEAIETGNYPEYELALQIVPEEEQLAYGFDLLDPTKVLPEELVPLRRVGRLTLDRNPDNFFAETEQVAFCIGNVVPGIDFTDDPLLQARLFSYLDTQLLRLGGPNFAEFPINRPLAATHNHQQDGFGRRTIPTARALYHPNSIAGNEPRLADPARGFVHHPERLQGTKTRERSESFADHYGQARMFLHSQSEPERRHLVDACRFEIGKVERLGIRERVVAHFARIDEDFAREVAEAVGVSALGRLPAGMEAPPRRARGREVLETSPALSLLGSPRLTIRTRKVALLAAEGVRAEDVDQIRAALCGEGATVEVVGPVLGALDSLEGRPIEAEKSFLTTASVLYDALVVPGGAASAERLSALDDARRFVRDAFRHAKPIGAANEGILLLEQALPELDPADIAGSDPSAGIVTVRAQDLEEFGAALVEALRQHRFFEREVERVPI